MSRVKVFQHFFFLMLDPGVESNSTEIYPEKNAVIAKKRLLY